MLRTRVGLILAFAADDGLDAVVGWIESLGTGPKAFVALAMVLAAWVAKDTLPDIVRAWLDYRRFKIEHRKRMAKLVHSYSKRKDSKREIGF